MRFLARTQSRLLSAGYPGKERIQGGMECNFGIYSPNGIASSVSDSKISWQVEREFMVAQRDSQLPPPNYDVGGISGGPMITLIERGGLLTWAAARPSTKPSKLRTPPERSTPQLMPTL
jgi:hypothetical protein